MINMIIDNLTIAKLKWRTNKKINVFFLINSTYIRKAVVMNMKLILELIQRIIIINRIIIHLNIITIITPIKPVNI